MTAVARVLPRNWDGRRLLRFLAGLAMLALAFTTPAAAAFDTPAPVAAVSETTPVAAVGETVTPASVAVSDSAPSTVWTWPATRPAGTVAILALGSLVVLIGATLRVRGQRAPPAI